jgi:hypothetical protein
MSKECIDKCPKIKKLLDEISSEYIYPIQNKFYDKNSALSRLVIAVKESYDCKGPGTCMKEVTKGIFRKTTKMEEQTTCRLDPKTK